MAIDLDVRILGLCVVKRIPDSQHQVVVGVNPRSYSGDKTIPTHRLYMVIPKNRIDRGRSDSALLDSAKTWSGFSVFQVEYETRVQLSVPQAIPTIFDSKSHPRYEPVCFSNLGLNSKHGLGKDCGNPRREWLGGEGSLLLLPVPADAANQNKWRSRWVDPLDKFKFRKGKVDEYEEWVVADSFVWRGGYTGSIKLTFADGSLVLYGDKGSFEIQACCIPEGCIPEEVEDKEPFGYSHGLERLSSLPWDDDYTPRPAFGACTIGSASCPPVCDY